MRRGILGRGILMKGAGSSPLGKLLRLSSGSTARARGTGRLMMLGAPFMIFTNHDLQREVKKIE
jgi:hypothetical protein